MFRITDHNFKLWKEYNDDLQWDAAPNVYTGDLSRSIWAMLAQGWLPPESPVETGSEWAHVIIEDAKKLPEVKKLHRRIDKDVWSVMVCHDVIMGAIGNSVPHTNDVVKPESLLRRELDGLQDLDQNGVVVTSQLSNIENAMNVLSNRAGAYCHEVIRGSSEIRNAIRQACEYARTKMDELSALEGLMGKGWGQGGTVASSKADIERRTALASRFWGRGNKIRRILDLAGRMTRVADKVQASKVDADVGEIVGVKFGDNIEAALPEELGRMVCGGDIEQSFWVDYMERSIMRYSCNDNQPKAKGPVVLLIDESGSMAGEREEWAKAIGLVASKICQDQNRDLVIGGFYTDITNVHVLDKGVMDEETLDWLNSNTSGGGTNYQPALDWALDQVESINQDTNQHADVIFITDDTCGVEELWLADWKHRKKSLGVRVVGLGIECDTHVLSMICDSTHSVSTTVMDSACAFNI